MSLFNAIKTILEVKDIYNSAKDGDISEASAIKATDKTIRTLLQNELISANGNILKFNSRTTIEPVILITQDAYRSSQRENLVNLNVDIFASSIMSAVQIMTNIDGMKFAETLNIISSRDASVATRLVDIGLGKAVNWYANSLESLSKPPEIDFKFESFLGPKIDKSPTAFKTASALENDSDIKKLIKGFIGDIEESRYIKGAKKPPAADRIRSQVENEYKGREEVDKVLAEREDSEYRRSMNRADYATHVDRNIQIITRPGSGDLAYGEVSNIYRNMLKYTHSPELTQKSILSYAVDSARSNEKSILRVTNQGYAVSISDFMKKRINTIGTNVNGNQEELKKEYEKRGLQFDQTNFNNTPEGHIKCYEELAALDAIREASSPRDKRFPKNSQWILNKKNKSVFNRDIKTLNDFVKDMTKMQDKLIDKNYKEKLKEAENIAKKHGIEREVAKRLADLEDGMREEYERRTTTQTVKVVEASSKALAKKEQIFYGIHTREFNLEITEKSTFVGGNKTAMVFVVPIIVRAIIIVLPVEDICQALESFREDKLSFFSRFYDWRVGLIKTSDLIFCTDIIENYRRYKFKNKDKLAEIINKRIDTANERALVSNGVGFVKNYNFYILSTSDVVKVNDWIKGSLEDDNKRDLFLNTGHGLALTIVDEEYSQVKLGLSGHKSLTTMTFKTLESRGKSEKAEEMELVRALLGSTMPKTLI